MKKLLFSTALAFVFFTFLASCDNPKPASDTTKNEDAMHKADSAKMAQMATAITDADKLRTAMRKLWEDHVTWTRNVIFCLVDNLPGADQATKRLLQNQDDIGNALKPYYGNEAATKLTNLLHEHITGAAAVVKAAKANDSKALEAANNKWKENADYISATLSTANPNWDLNEIKMMMHDHLKLTTDEAVARIKKDYDADIKAYDAVHEEILKMSDMLSEGIIKQFPDKFK